MFSAFRAGKDEQPFSTATSKQKQGWTSMLRTKVLPTHLCQLSLHAQTA